MNNDLRATARGPLVAATGLPFRPIDANYPPWRNYSRVFRTAMLVAKVGNVARPTRVAQLLATDGAVTSDDYFHFLAQGFTDPAPSFQGWTPTDQLRFPLLFALKFSLARANVGRPIVTYREIIGAYVDSGFDGEEDQASFIGLANGNFDFAGEHRQARESIQVISQISYLSATFNSVIVSRTPTEALDIFLQLEGIRGEQANDSEQEILRVAALFEASIASLDLDYAQTTLNETVEAGFEEGTRVERTHIVLERNPAIRNAFFKSHPTTECDFCGRDTNAEYPWADRVLDIHHVLPLCSGTRSDTTGTVLTDLVALCPTCHRAVHLWYAKWLKEAGRKDFVDAAEARQVYDEAKNLKEVV